MLLVLAATHLITWKVTQGGTPIPNYYKRPVTNSANMGALYGLHIAES